MEAKLNSSRDTSQVVYRTSGSGVDANRIFGSGDEIAIDREAILEARFAMAMGDIVERLVTR